MISVGSVVQVHPDPPTEPLDECSYGGHSSAGRAPALQAGGHRFDPGWLHQPLDFSNNRTARPQRERLRGQLFRLLFNNSEEARRVRFVTSEPGSSGYEIALFAPRLVAANASQAHSVIRKRTARAVLRVIGSSEKVHVVDALATTGDEGRCSLR